MALIPRFTYHQPTDFQEALRLMAQYGFKARALAGGTDLVRKLKARKINAEHIVSLNRIDSLRSITWDEKNGLSIGAGARISEVGRNERVIEHYPSLMQACHVMATTQIRNMGTVVGNITNGSPCADTACPLLCYDGIVVIASLEGVRKVPLVEFFKAPSVTDVREGELVAAIEVPRPVPGVVSSYLRLSARSQVDIAAVNAGAAIKVDKSRRVEKARLTLGAVAPTPLRLVRAEKLLTGKTFDPETIEAAVIEGAKAARPITDIRATAEYRNAMVLVLLRRALAYCLAKIDTAVFPSA
jgi:CO/xanthine dehydrogenase FAD-binding subunit